MVLRRRRAKEPAGFPDEWRALLRRRVRHFSRFSPEERERLENVVLDLVADKRWEAAQGFELTDEMIVTIAGQAAVLVLALPDNAYRDVGTIIVHPTTMVLEGEHSLVHGVMSDDPMPIEGQADFGGPVVLAWDVVRRDARHPGTGSNVVFHEFAHKLDMLDGWVDGTPPLSGAKAQRWVEVCTRVYERVATGQGGRMLSSYAGVNPAEFFAVSTEVFFDDPVGLREEHPDLYEVLADFYRQDPASRVPDVTPPVVDN